MITYSEIQTIKVIPVESYEAASDSAHHIRLYLKKDSSNSMEKIRPLVDVAFCNYLRSQYVCERIRENRDNLDIEVIKLIHRLQTQYIHIGYFNTVIFCNDQPDYDHVLIQI